MHLSAVARPTFVQTVLPGSGILREILMVLGFSLIVALTAQVSIQLPFTPVPISGQTFGVLLAGAALGSVRGSASLLSYVGLGAVGLPVFARTGGPATYGYIAGFVLAAFVVGWLAERGWDRSFPRSVGAMFVGNVMLYIPGLLWLATFVGADQVLTAGLLPFIPGDTIKLLLAAAALPTAWAVVNRRERGPDER